MGKNGDAAQVEFLDEGARHLLFYTAALTNRSNR